jgi:carbamoyl-phosphate synthase large subunit
MKILVTGIGGPAGKRTSELIKRKYKNSYLVGVDMRETAKGMIDKFYRVPPGKSPEFIWKIIKIVKKERIELIIPTVDEELLALSNNKEKLRRITEILISPPKTIEIADDKLKTVKFLEKNELPVPKSCLPSEFDGGISFPLLVKPRVGRGGKGIKIIKAINELNYDDSFLIQEFLQGEDFTGMALIDRKSEIRQLKILKKTKLEFGNFGNAIETEVSNSPDIENLMRKLIKKMEFEGPIDVDIRKNENGKAMFLEINPRVGGSIHKVPEIITEILRMGGLR